MTEHRRFRARWIFPVTSAPIADGVIELDPHGRIASIGAASSRDTVDLGRVAVVPAFVNAHTHLEFSDLVEPLQPARPFSAWMGELVRDRRRRGAGRFAAIEQGIAECHREGVGGVGEIATDDATPRETSAGSLRLVAFRELIGFAPERVEAQLEIARRFLDPPEPDPPGLTRGLSPHAPYSVNPRLLEGVVELAARSPVPLTMHLAETLAELELLDRGTGEFVELLSALGAWQDDVLAPGTRPLDVLRQLAPAQRVLIAHGNYLDSEEIDFLAAHRQFTVVYCPRTHAFFGHREHPWRTLLSRGARVAIGTDGRCSNPDLSIWNELLFLRGRFPDVDPALLLELGTRRGAEALGLEDELGSIEVGREARFALIELGGNETGEPFEELFHANSRVASMFGL